MDFYRCSAVGISLIETLNEMLQTKEISEEEAVNVLETFDEEFPGVLNEHYHQTSQRSIKSYRGEGKLSNYTNIEELWKVDLEDFKLNVGNVSKQYSHARLLLIQENPKVRSSSKASKSRS